MRRKNNFNLNGQISYLKNILFNIPGCVFWKDVSGIYLGCSRVFLEMAGVESEENVIGKTDNDFSWRDQASDLRKNDLLVIESRKTKIFIEEGWLPNGEKKIFSVVKTPLYDNNGINVIGIVGTSVDINRNFVLEHILINLPGHVYWKDKAGVYLGCNDRQANSLGLDFGKQVIGKTDFDLPWGRKTAEKFRENDLKVIETETSLVIEEPAIANGRPAIVLSQKLPLRDTSGNVMGVLGISVDITQLKETQVALQIAKDKAEAANQAKNEFLENMRHDIRTPLSGIVGCAELLQSKIQDPIVTEYANDLVQSSYGLLDFLNSVLEGVQIATGEIPLLKKKFDLHKQLLAIINLNKSLASEKHLDLQFDYDDTIPKYLIGDPVRIQRIVLELVSNALTFTNKGQVIVKIKLKKKESREIIIEISVSDTGIGIAEDKQEEIFLRFKRLIPSYKGIYKGLGLGLTTVKQFIDDLDGEIYVDSKPDKGSTFTCLLAFQEPLIMDDVGVAETPLFVSKASKKPVKSIQPNASDAVSTNRVLVVEDNLIAARAAAHVMSEFNCTIDIAPDGKATMELLQKHNYQLILMDIGLPDTDGIALTHRIRLNQWKKNYETIPIIGLTAHIGERKQECLDAGMNLVIHKPLKKETVQELLATFVKNTPSNEVPLSIIPVIKGTVIDFDEIKKLLKDEKIIEECRQLIITSLNEDLAKLADFSQAEDWKSIHFIAHKWQGGATYYGAKRLEQACKNFNDYWAVSKKEQLKTFYHQLVQEMETVKEVYVNPPQKLKK